MNSIPPDRLGIPEEILKLRPPTTAAQGAARRKADLELDEKYAGNYVAYLDQWKGDELERTVVAFAPKVAEFHEKLAHLPPAVRQRVECTHLPEADAINVPSVWLGE